MEFGYLVCSELYVVVVERKGERRGGAGGGRGRRQIKRASLSGGDGFDVTYVGIVQIQKIPLGILGAPI